VNERLSQLQTIRRTRTSGTAPLAFPTVTIIAHELAVMLHQGNYDSVPGIFAKIADAEELLAIRNDMNDQGVPFDTLFPVGKTETFKALQAILDRSSEDQLSLFSDSLTLLEMEALGRFKH
jgi:hypothetical protein